MNFFLILFLTFFMINSKSHARLKIIGMMSLDSNAIHKKAPFVCNNGTTYNAIYTIKNTKEEKSHSYNSFCDNKIVLESDTITDSIIAKCLKSSRSNKDPSFKNCFNEYLKLNPYRKIQGTIPVPLTKSKIFRKENCSKDISPISKYPYICECPEKEEYDHRSGKCGELKHDYNMTSFNCSNNKTYNIMKGSDSYGNRSYSYLVTSAFCPRDNTKSRIHNIKLNSSKAKEYLEGHLCTDHPSVYLKNPETNNCYREFLLLNLGKKFVYNLMPKSIPKSINTQHGNECLGGELNHNETMISCPNGNKFYIDDSVDQRFPKARKFHKQTKGASPINERSLKR